MRSVYFSQIQYVNIHLFRQSYSLVSGILIIQVLNSVESPFPLPPSQIKILDMKKTNNKQPILLKIPLQFGFGLAHVISRFEIFFLCLSLKRSNKQYNITDCPLKHKCFFLKKHFHLCFFFGNCSKKLPRRTNYCCTYFDPKYLKYVIALLLSITQS